MLQTWILYIFFFLPRFRRVNILASILWWKNLAKGYSTYRWCWTEIWRSLPRIHQRKWGLERRERGRWRKLRSWIQTSEPGECDGNLEAILMRTWRPVTLWKDDTLCLLWFRVCKQEFSCESEILLKMHLYAACAPFFLPLLLKQWGRATVSTGCELG